MKKAIIIFLVTLLFSVGSVFAKEILVPGFDYVFELEDEKDFKFAFEKIKEQIKLHRYFFCSVEEGITNDREYTALLIRRIVNSNDKEMIIYSCDFFIFRKKLQILFSDMEIEGLTEPYTEEEIPEVYSKITDMIRHEMGFEILLRNMSLQSK